MLQSKSVYGVTLLLSMAVLSGNSLTIVIENKSSVTLEWSRSKIFHPGTKIDLEPKIILPGNTTTITAEAPRGVDLSARVFFTNDDMLRIEDFQQARPTPSTFKMNSQKIQSTIKSMRQNPERDPKKISYTHVDLSLRDNQ